MNQPYVYIYPLPLEPPSHHQPHPTLRGHQSTKLTSRCYAIQQLPTRCLFHTWSGIYVNATLSIHSHLCFPPVSTSLFSTSAPWFLSAIRFISAIFLDSIYMHLTYNICFFLLHSVWLALGSTLTSLRLNFIPFNGWVIFHCWLPWCLQWRYWFDSWVGKDPHRRKWQPTSVFSPGKSHGQRSLAGYSPWGHKRVIHDLKDQTTNIPLNICTTTSLSTHLLVDT